MEKYIFNTDEYNSILLEHNNYKNHKQMLPFVGVNYGKLKKLLIVGESHYLHNSNSEFSQIYSDIINNWYSVTHGDIFSKIGKKIGSDIISCTNTIANVNAFITNCRTLPAYRIYKNVSDVAMKNSFFKGNNIEPFTYIAYMNFFQRPAELTGEKINPSKVDVEIAKNVFSHVINTIKTDYIFVVSSNVWDYLHSIKFENIITGHSCHPGCAWWNIKAKKYTKYPPKIKVTGKESFNDFLIVNKIFDEKLRK